MLQELIQTVMLMEIIQLHVRKQLEEGKEFCEFLVIIRNGTEALVVYDKSEDYEKLMKVLESEPFIVEEHKTCTVYTSRNFKVAKTNFLGLKESQINTLVK